MRKGLFLTITLVLAAYGALTTMGTSLPDRPAAGPAGGGELLAVVNGEPIPVQEAEKRLRLILFLNGWTNPPERQLAHLRRQVNRLMIEETLLLQEAGRRRLRPGGRDVARRQRDLTEWMQAAAGGTPEGFRQALDGLSLTENDLRVFAERTVTVQALIERIRGEVRVSDEDLRAHYEKNRGKMKHPEQVNLRVITLNTEAAARDVLQRLQRGADFAELARRLSQDRETRDAGGSLGWVTRGDVVLGPEVEESAFALQPGETSDVVQSHYGYQILKVEGVRPARDVTFEEVRDNLHQVLLERKQRQAVPDLIDQLKSRGKVQIFESSAEPGSGGR